MDLTSTFLISIVFVFDLSLFEVNVDGIISHKKLENTVKIVILLIMVLTDE